MTRRPLDAELVRRGMAASTDESVALITQGRVTVNKAPAGNPASRVAPTDDIHVTPPQKQYVSRGGNKLEHALDQFGIDPAGLHVLDAGCSTGGFTDCVLQRGATHVTAVDVAYGEIAHKLRVDSRVTLYERTNVRHITPDTFADGHPAPVDLVVCDVSFIGLEAVIAPLRAVAPTAAGIFLVKPQFEAAHSDIEEGGVVRGRDARASAIAGAAAAAQVAGWPAVGCVESPLRGPAGNAEYLLHLASDSSTLAATEAELTSVATEG